MRFLRVYGAAALAPGLLLGVTAFNLAAFWTDEGSGLPLRLTAAGVVLVVVTAGIGTLILRREGRDGPGYGVGSLQTTTVPVRGGPDLHTRIKIALLALRAEIREADADAGRYVAETGSGRGGSGERVTVELSGDPASPQARISSRPRKLWELHDWGRSRRHVRSVVEALQE